LADEDLINCHSRAIRCLSYIRDLLKFCARKWDLHGPLEQFENESESLRNTLMDSSMGCMSGQGIYSHDMSSELYSQDPSTGMLLVGDSYSGYHYAV
jgi:hypothetical protein